MMAKVFFIDHIQINVIRSPVGFWHISQDSPIFRRI